jgi:hypothetical protein
MLGQIVRFYARALRPAWDFLDREMPPQEIVRRFGRSYGGEPHGGGWYSRARVRPRR